MRLNDLERATQNRARAQEEWETALRQAVLSHSLRAVGQVAGISHARVAQIVGPKHA